MSAVAVERFTPYSTVIGMASAMPSWIPGLDAQRITAYQIYQQIYDNVPETFAMVSRGTEDEPIYLPTPRTIIDTIDRYLAPDLAFSYDGGDDGDAMAEILKEALEALFKRERFYSKFESNKKYGLIRGDWCFHILANDLKPQGSRISIQTLDPGSYFPVYHPNDPDRMIAAYIVEQIETEPGSGEYIVKRQTYTRGLDPLNNDGSDLSIWNSVATFDPEAWFALSDKAITTLKPPTQLPPEITAIPIYHIRNAEEPGNPFGASEMKAQERIFAALNQAITDEELTLAYQGLGMYATDGGAPVDEDGLETDWILGPGRVVEHKSGSKFARIEGVGSVAPMQDHLKFLLDQVKQSTGANDAAIGKIDANVAESGVSLVIQLGPILAKCKKNTRPITDVLTNMTWDLKSWLAAYETINTGIAFATPIYANPIPTNKQAEFDNILALVAAKIVSVQWAVTELSKLGYDIPADDFSLMAGETKTLADASDVLGARLTAEDTGTDEETDNAA